MAWFCREKNYPYGQSPPKGTFRKLDLPLCCSIKVAFSRVFFCIILYEMRNIHVYVTIKLFSHSIHICYIVFGLPQESFKRWLINLCFDWTLLLQSQVRTSCQRGWPVLSLEDCCVLQSSCIATYTMIFKLWKRSWRSRLKIRLQCVVRCI